MSSFLFYVTPDLWLFSLCLYCASFCISHPFLYVFSHLMTVGLSSSTSRLRVELEQVSSYTTVWVLLSNLNWSQVFFVPFDLFENSLQLSSCLLTFISCPNPCVRPAVLSRRFCENWTFLNKRPHSASSLSCNYKELQAIKA